LELRKRTSGCSRNISRKIEEFSGPRGGCIRSMGGFDLELSQVYIFIFVQHWQDNPWCVFPPVMLSFSPDGVLVRVIWGALGYVFGLCFGQLGIFPPFTDTAEKVYVWRPPFKRGFLCRRVLNSWLSRSFCPQSSSLHILQKKTGRLRWLRGGPPGTGSPAGVFSPVFTSPGAWRRTERN